MSSTDKDEFLNDLSTLWRSQTTETKIDLDQVRLLQKKRRLALFFDLLQVLVLLASGAYFCWFYSSYYVVIAGAYLFVSGVLLLVAALSIHWRVVNYADWSSLGVLQYRKLAFNTSIKHWRIHQIGCLAVLVFAVATVLIYCFGNVEVITEALMFAYLIATPLLIGLYLYLDKRISHIKTKLADVEETIKELQSESR